MNTTIRNTVVIIIAVFAGLVVSCDVGIVGGFYEDSTTDLNEFIAIVMFTSPFVITVASIIKLSIATGTTRGDIARAFVGLIVVGCLTPAIMIALWYLDPGGGKQYGHTDQYLALAVQVGLVIGGMLVLTGLTGWGLLRLREDNGDAEKQRKSPLYGPVPGQPNDSA